LKCHTPFRDVVGDNRGMKRTSLLLTAGSWQVMLHALASFNDLRATGLRGGEKQFSTNWVMGMAQRPLGGGESDLPIRS